MRREPARADERAQHAVVGDDDERVPADVRERARERGVDAREQLRVVLTAGRCGELAAAPRLAHPGPARVDLVAGVALPLAAVAFAEPASGMTGHSRWAAMISAVRAARPRSEV